jgi:prevent-host-death family protein
MSEVSISDLRKHGGVLVDRAGAGERIVVTRHGKAVAELRPLPSRGLTSDELVRRWSRLSPMDPDMLRTDLDALIDPSL